MHRYSLNIKIYANKTKRQGLQEWIEYTNYAAKPKDQENNILNISAVHNVAA